MAGTTIVSVVLGNASPLHFTAIGAALVVLISVLYYAGVFRSKDSAKDKNRKGKSRPYETQKGEGGKKEVKKNSNKQFNPIERKNRQQPVFVHPWSVGSLKGHTSPVLDLDLSSNGKYMASCAEDPPPLLEKMSTKHTKEDEDELTTSVIKPDIRRRNLKFSTQVKNMPKNNGFHSKLYRKLGLSNAQIYKLLDDHVIAKKQLGDYGYPVDFQNDMVYIEPSKNFNTSNEEVRLSLGGYNAGNDIIIRNCCRCRVQYFVYSNGDYLSADPCPHHWGKLRRSGKENEDLTYSCCNGASNTSGCILGKYHVSAGATSGYLTGFVKTKPCKTVPEDGDYGTYAVDCEMCYTTHGLELVKVTLVKPDGSVAYNTMVNPTHPIVDYNTRFSGITEKHFREVTKSLKDVQDDLLGLIDAETILIGHSLENDLRSLKLMHSNVVDTSIVFPHFHGLPYRRSLKSLVSCFLKKDIQTHVHNSIEDARASLELMLWRLKKDLN